MTTSFPGFVLSAHLYSSAHIASSSSLVYSVFKMLCKKWSCSILWICWWHTAVYLICHKLYQCHCKDVTIPPGFEHVMKNSWSKFNTTKHKVTLVGRKKCFGELAGTLSSLQPKVSDPSPPLPHIYQNGMKPSDPAQLVTKFGWSGGITSKKHLLPLPFC